MSDEINRTILVVGEQGTGKSYCMVRRIQAMPPPAVRLLWDPNLNCRLGGAIIRHDTRGQALDRLIREYPDDLHALDFCRVGTDEAHAVARGYSSRSKVDHGTPVYLGIDEAITVPDIRAARPDLPLHWADSLARRRHLRMCLVVCATYAKQIHRTLRGQATEIVLFRQADQYDLDALHEARVPEPIIRALPTLPDHHHITWIRGTDTKPPTNNPLE